jgi:putative inorganic carbon (HCO3(-)) transporter
VRHARSTARDPQQDDRDSRIYYYWLLLALFVEYARPASYYSFLQIPLLYSAIPLSLFAASFFAKGLRPVSEVFADPQAKWIPVFMGLIAFSLVHADVTMYVTDIFKAVFGFAVLGLLIARIVINEARFRGVVMTLLVAHLFLLAMNPNVVTQPEQRNYILGATFLGDGNDFSMSLCIVVPAMVAVALGAKTLWGRLFSWLGMAMSLLAIVASQSRGAGLGFAAVLVYVWLLSPRKMLVLGLVMLVGIGVMLYAPPVYFQRMGTIGNYQTEGSAQGRIVAWKAGVRMATDNPLTGVGAGHYAVSFGTKYRPNEAGIPWLTAHSSYFLVLGELGFPGIIVFLIMVIGNILLNGRMRRFLDSRGPGAEPAAFASDRRLLILSAGAALGFAVAGAFLSAAYYPHVYVLSGLLIAVRSIVATRAGVKVEHVLKPPPKTRRGRGRAPQPAASPPA